MIKWFFASAAVCVSALLVGGCAMGAPESTGDESAPELTEEPALQTQSTGVERWTTYYAEAAHINVVGECLFSSCPPKGTSCWGIKTSYYDVIFDSCSY